MGSGGRGEGARARRPGNLHFDYPAVDNHQAGQTRVPARHTPPMSDKRRSPAELLPGRMGDSARFGLGLGLLSVCILVSGGLALEQLGWSNLPGCGPGSGCRATLTGPWGHLLGWPTSFVSLAYFAALLGDWIRTFRGRPTTGLRWLTRLGGLAAVIFLAGGALKIGRAHV